MAMSGTAASAEFEVLDTGNTPANGSVTVTYLGEQVTTNYLSTWSPFGVAASIANNINNDSDIQLKATIPNYGETEVEIREKRTGSEYNGNPVYITHTNGTHITIDKYMAVLQGGTD